MSIEIKPKESEEDGTAKFELKHLNATVILPTQDTIRTWVYVRDIMDTMLLKSGYKIKLQPAEEKEE
jgi:hypothetical protein